MRKDRRVLQLRHVQRDESQLPLPQRAEAWD
jgi:hypothetical protein